MNATTSVLQDKNLRLAISYLIDRQSIVEVFGGDLMCQPAYSYVTKNILFHCDDTDEYYKTNYADNKDYDIGISNYWWSEPAYHLWMIVYDQNNGIDMEKYRAMCSEVENSFNGEETFKLVDETQRYLMDHVTLAPLYITSFAQAYYNDVKPIFVVDGLFLNDCK